MMKKNIICVTEPFYCTAVNNTTCSSTFVAAQWVSFIWLCDPMDCSTPRRPCPSLPPRVCSNSSLLSRWCRSTISSFVVPPLLLLPLIFPSIRAFSNETAFFFFLPGSQSIGASVSASVFPVNIQGWFSLGWTGLISLLSKRLSRDFSSTSIQRHQFFSIQSSLWFNSHIQTRTSPLAPQKRICLQFRSHRTLEFNPWVRKIPWRGHGSPLQYSCLESFIDRGAWQAI